MLVESFVMLTESSTVVFSSGCLRTMFISPSPRRLYYIAFIYLTSIIALRQAYFSQALYYVLRYMGRLSSHTGYIMLSRRIGILILRASCYFIFTFIIFMSFVRAGSRLYFRFSAPLVFMALPGGKVDPDLSQGSCLVWDLIISFRYHYIC